MKTIVCFLAVLALLPSALFAQNKSLEWYDSEEFHVSLQLPKDWEITVDKIDGHKAVSAHSKDNSLHIVIEMFENDDLSLSDVLKEAEQYHAMNISKSEKKKINGSDALVAEGAFKFEGKLYRAVAMAAKHSKHNYIIYAFATPARFGMSKSMFTEIIETFSPWSKHATN
jgi:hypothetical protein